MDLFRRGVGFLAVAHCVNDFLNGVVGSILPLLFVQFHMNYVQIGTLMMVSNVSSSLVQPLLGYISDRKGTPWLLPFGAIALGLGLVLIPYTPSFVWLVPAVILSGAGSAAFHPDASRAVYFAAGQKRGLAQSIFQIGGNSGMALAPLALLFLGHVGLGGTIWFMIPAVLSMVLMISMMRWFSVQLSQYRSVRKARAAVEGEAKPFGLGLLVFTVIIRSWIVSGVTTFVPLLVMHRDHISAENVWVYSFVFLLFGAIGTMLGGPLADRFGQRTVIRMSMITATPFAILLPYLPQGWVLADLALLGVTMMSTFAVTIVYGQAMLPANIAMVSGLLIGFAGGVAGIAVMLMGDLADATHSLTMALAVVMWSAPVAAISSLLLPMDHRSIRRQPLAAEGATAVRH